MTLVKGCKDEATQSEMDKQSKPVQEREIQN